MKKTLLSLFTILGFAATAQTLTYANHAPAWYNIPYSTTQCDSLGVVPGASGAGAVWSFTPTNLHSAKTYTTSNTAPNNPSYPSANVSVYSSTTDVAYHNTNTSAYKYYGGNLVINSYDLNVKYANPAVLAVYPMSLNTTTTSITSGTIALTVFGFPLTPTFNGTCTVTADATGTLVLPGHTFNNAIRLTTTQILSASGATVNLVNYDYYAVSASKAPIYSIQTSTINASGQPTSTQTITTVIANWTDVGINDIQESEIELSIFPNPASNVINFTTVSMEAAKVIAFDVTGKTVATELMEMGKAKINLTNLSSGVYMYRVVNKDNQVLKAGKFNVAK